MRKVKKIIYITILCIGCIGLLACSKENSIEKKQETEIQSTEKEKTIGNLTMKDEDGNVVITGKDIKLVEPVVNENNGYKEYCVSIVFTDDGKEKFAKVTEANIGKKLSINVDDEVISAPMVRNVITGGSCIIDGIQSYDECEKLVERIYQDSKTEEKETVKRPDLKITENDGTILVTDEQIDTYYCESLEIGKGGSAVEVIIIEFTDEGKEIMKNKTSKLKGKEINLVIKGKLVYDCVLTEPITEGKWVIKDFNDNEEKYKITDALGDVLY